jgi:DNA-binding CsgD family transcriptional regulator
VVGVAEAGVPTNASVALELAAALAGSSSLSETIEVTLPALARACGAPVAVFAVAGSNASGARSWPRTAEWGRALESELGTLWDSGPLTELARSLGVVAPFRLADLMRRLGWDALPIRSPVNGEPLRHALYLPVAVVGRTVCGYFVGRVDRDFTDEEVDLASALQAAVVASHGRFFRGSSESAVLTPRQHEILHLMRLGLTTGAIASRLGISVSTVGKHLRDLYARLDTHDRVSTVREAAIRGLLDGVAGEPWQDVRFHA